MTHFYAILFVLPLVACITQSLPWGKHQRILQLIFAWLWLIILSSLHFVDDKTQVIHLGNWQSPFGIALMITPFVLNMLNVFAFACVAINHYALSDQDLFGKHHNSYRWFCLGHWLLVFAITGALTTTDIFNLYVWSELMLAAAFIVLLAVKRPAIKAVIQYALLNITGTLFFLLAVALIYGISGSLSYAKIAGQLQNQPSTILLAALSLLIVGLAVKAAVFPLYFWLTTVYHRTSYSATMLLSSLSTKTIMLVLLILSRLWLPFFTSPTVHHLLLIGAAATMLFGVLGAASRWQIRPILTFHIVSQIGYILFAIALPGSWAFVAAAFFIVHNVLVKTNLLLISGLIEQRYGLFDLKQLRQVWQQHRLILISFLLSALSLAGLPPLSGFWGKLLVFKSAVDHHSYITLAIGIFVSLLTLYSMIKIWRYAFCQQDHSGHPINNQNNPYPKGALFASLLLLTAIIIISLKPDTVLHHLQQDTGLYTPQTYLHLLGGK